ncbi:MAG: hypothetical protein M3179_03660 [Actinomycetota bacterium]|nr:hypothetical protein [Actinomycetota bacterium]
MATAMRGRASTGGEADSDAAFVSKWIPIWAGLLTVVTLVVVVFLITISNSLAAINGDLAVADEAVTGAGGDVPTLPGEVETVTGHLTNIDEDVKPIQTMTDQIIGSLRSIDGKLANVDASLKDTGPILANGVLPTANNILGVLRAADDPPDRLGVQNIHQRLAFANGVGNTGPFGQNPANVQVIIGQARTEVGILAEVNKHLTSICRSPAVQGPKAC